MHEWRIYQTQHSAQAALAAIDTFRFRVTTAFLPVLLHYSHYDA
jgi:hypothetical protein